MISIKRLIVSQMQTNCYILYKDSSCIVIDPGDCADLILDFILLNNLKIEAILATHCHFDHIMAVGEIQSSFPQLPFFFNMNDNFLIDRLTESAMYFLNYKPAILPIFNKKNLDVSSFKISTFECEILKLPGHTPGSVGFYFKAEKFLVAGDTIFQSGVARTDFSYSDKSEYEKSLQKIFKLHKEVLVLPGHGKNFQLKNIATLKKT